MIIDSYIDHYWVWAGKNLEDSSTPKTDRVLVYLNLKNHYFLDIKSYNAFVKIRTDHLKKLGVTKYIELDFFEVSFSKYVK